MGERIGRKADAFLLEENMKKYRKRIVPDYDAKYAEYEPEYYGVFLKKEDGIIQSVKVDPKRMRKTRLIDNDTYNKIQQINRNTPYFHPEKKILDQNCYDIFNSKLDGLRKLWFQEIKPAVSKLKTPEDAGQQAFLGSIADGVMEYDECEMTRMFATISREPEYSYAIRMFYAQFLLLLGASTEAVMVQVITKKGYAGDKFNRDNLKSYVSGRVPGLDYTKFDNHCYYDKVYKIWNFLKHNNLDVYTKVKENYPELLINPKVSYENGDSAIRYLNLTEDLVLELLDGLGKFFNEFCSKVFDENPNCPEWNKEAFYVKSVNAMIDDVTNPLGLPWYV